MPTLRPNGPCLIWIILPGTDPDYPFDLFQITWDHHRDYNPQFLYLDSYSTKKDVLIDFPDTKDGTLTIRSR